MITDAPWYVSNDTLPIDLNITDVATTIDITRTKLHITIRNFIIKFVDEQCTFVPGQCLKGG